LVILAKNTNYEDTAEVNFLIGCKIVKWKYEYSN